MSEERQKRTGPSDPAVRELAELVRLIQGIRDRTKTLANELIGDDAPLGNTLEAMIGYLRLATRDAEGFLAREVLNCAPVCICGCDEWERSNGDAVQVACRDCGFLVSLKLEPEEMPERPPQRVEQQREPRKAGDWLIDDIPF